MMVDDPQGEARYGRLSDNVNKLLRTMEWDDAIEHVLAASNRAFEAGDPDLAKDFDDMRQMIYARMDAADMTLLTALQDIGQGFELS